MTTCLVRESGGVGDVVCIGAASRALKRERPHERIVVLVPEEFLDIVQHLEGIDVVESLGSLQVLQKVRRLRDAELDPDCYPYLSPLRKYPDAKWISLYCPGYLSESTNLSTQEYCRDQLFAIAAGAKKVLDARPGWIIRDDEQEQADNWLKKNGVSDGTPLIVAQLRSTCAARSLTIGQSTELLEGLVKLGTVVILDCITPKYEVPDSVLCCLSQQIPFVAAILNRSTLLVSVDSFSLHIAGALEKSAIGMFGPTAGRAILQTYTDQVAVEVEGCKRCPQPCCYNVNKGWSRECRQTGCERMLKHDMDTILSLTEKKLRSSMCLV
jgi:ADP-heptose:LPS heptosyltransferase